MLLTPAARCAPQQVETSPRKSQRLLKVSALYIYPNSATIANFWCASFTRKNFLRFSASLDSVIRPGSRRSLLSLWSVCFVGHRLASSRWCFQLKRTCSPRVTTSISHFYLILHVSIIKCTSPTHHCS